MVLGGIALLSACISGAVCYFSGSFESAWWALWLPLSFLGSVIVLAVLSFGFLWLMIDRVDTSKPVEHDSKFYRRMVEEYVIALQIVLRIWVRTEGLEQTPKNGRFMLVCNHTSLADPVLLLRYFRGKQLAFISKQENADMFLVGKVMHPLLCQTINRENDREALKTIVKCIQLIKDDKVSMGVFPEGYIHPDKKLHRFRSGVFKIAQKTQVPIVVCTLKNTPQVFENMAKLKSTHVELHLVQVLQPADYAGMSTVELGQKVYELMAADLGPDWVSTEED